MTGERRKDLVYCWKTACEFWCVNADCAGCDLKDINSSLDLRQVWQWLCTGFLLLTCFCWTQRNKVH